MKTSTYPSGWNKDRIRKVLEHYETQTEDEAVAEDESMFQMPDQTVMEVPTELVPAVRELLAKHSAI